ncbi:hypothetical protein M378DRAFT_23648 [Amanita muscaria Koide BX008]|uniref:Uncharacterized protein n=1 Tax=Amanita muscaria (strain Koide BX008) TaxID=946122 RepID=A0A0C2SS34_AMAMK|nr:hypothetical protein M378DRAFT_23648 [Amanita muscaria Koide BX008]
MHYYADLEEGEIRELVAPYTPVSNCQKSQSPSRASATMSSANCGSSSSTSRTTDDIGTTRHFRGSNDSGYYDNSDDDSIRSSRPCTPPGLCISKGAVPHAPEPVFRTMSSFQGLTRTNLESPTPQPTSSPRFRGSGSEIRDDRKRSREENPEPPVVCPAETWEIAPDVYEKVQSALARVLAMDQAGAGSEWGCQQTAGSQPAQKCSVKTVTEDQVEEYGCRHDHKAPKSPLSPEELERAIGIIEELSVMNGVPPDVFVQSGVSPGTLYHAFKHLGHTLERYFEEPLPKSPAPSFCEK